MLILIGHLHNCIANSKEWQPDAQQNVARADAAAPKFEPIAQWAALYCPGTARYCSTYDVPRRPTGDADKEVCETSVWLSTPSSDLTIEGVYT